jgi:imidazolonepropionase-like amidohydrolase
MTRTLLSGGRVFDGTGSPPRQADVLVEDGRILEVGPGLDGDEAVDVDGRHLLPGLFDCHTHVTLSHIIGIYLHDEAIELLLERGAWLVPTLVAPRGVLAAAEAGVPVPDAARRKAVEVSEAHADSFRRAVAAGVKVAMGTDSGITPHGRNLAELELMAKGGMTPAQVLAATTSSAAEELGVAGELGTLAPGRRADVVVVDGDPFELATLPDRIAAVVKDGRLVAGHV